jgi:hypothetical protein
MIQGKDEREKFTFILFIYRRLNIVLQILGCKIEKTE